MISNREPTRCKRSPWCLTVNVAVWHKMAAGHGGGVTRFSSSDGPVKAGEKKQKKKLPVPIPSRSCSRSREAGRPEGPESPQSGSQPGGGRRGKRLNASLSASKER